MLRPSIISLLLSSLLALFPATAQDEAFALPTEDPNVPDDGCRVSILGYHDFSATEPETAMRISTKKFREQMQALRTLGIPVISMEDFRAWKAGEKKLPPKSILITIDDGWKTVYQDAYPILREFNYPFTIFLYKQYVDGGGKALTTPMIKEMMRHGATVGSHSVTHPYPIVVKKHRKRGPEAYRKFLQTEMGESKSFLSEKFNTPVNTYAYPGGFLTGEMFPLADEVGYTELFTVQPGKVKRSTPNKTLPRYIILGNYDRVFDFATTFPDSVSGGIGSVVEPAAGTMTPRTAHPVSPEAGSIINSRLPLISADLSKVADLNPASITMQVAGFGTVPANYDASTRKVSWQTNRRLREPNCTVKVTWKNHSGKLTETPLRWTFQIDRGAAYLPETQ